jgi:hypothetical protein
MEMVRPLGHATHAVPGRLVPRPSEWGSLCSFFSLCAADGRGVALLLSEALSSWGW